MTPNAAAERQQLSEEFSRKLARFRVDDLLLVVSLSLTLNIDNVIELLTENGQCMQKIPMIEKILQLIPIDLLPQLMLMVDFLSTVCLTKLWMVYALKRESASGAGDDDDADDGGEAEAAEVTVDSFKDAIETVFASEKIPVTVDVLRFLDRFFIQIDFKEKKTQLQYFPKTKQLWARYPINKLHLKLTIKSLEFESMVLLREEHKNDYELTKLWLQFFKKSQINETLPAGGQSTVASSLANRSYQATINRTLDRNTGSVERDIRFVEQQVPRTQSLVINVKNAKLGSAFDFPALKSEIDQDVRFDFRITIKSKSIKRTLKTALERGDLFATNRLPIFFREHFSGSASNEITYEVPDMSDDEDEERNSGVQNRVVEVVEDRGFNGC